MTSVGRGRGRGWATAPIKEPALRRPGEPSSQKEIDYVTLVNKISHVDSDENYNDSIQEIIQLTNNMTQKESLKEIINNLYQYAIGSREIREKIMLLYDNESFRRISDNKGQSTFSLFFTNMQDDYQRRNELRQENLEHFRNVVSLLCDTYQHMKNTITGCSKILEVPLIDYMEMLLDIAALEDLEIVVEQLASNGKYLHARHQAEIDKLMITVRETLITKNLCSTSYGLLLYAIDLASQGFNKIPSNLQKFYAAQLANTSFMQGQHSVKDLPAGALANAENEETERSKMTEQRNYPSHKNNAVPRAIRGSGAKEHNKGYAKQRNTSTSAPRHSSNNKAWEHDDRFEKSYET